MDDLQQQYLWENTGERFTCTIENPTQQSKMKGLMKLPKSLFKEYLMFRVEEICLLQCNTFKHGCNC